MFSLNIFSYLVLEKLLVFVFFINVKLYHSNLEDVKSILTWQTARAHIDVALAGIKVFRNGIKI